MPPEDKNELFARYVRIVAETRVRTYSTESQDAIRINAFITTHTGRSYNDFCSTAHPEKISDGSYRLLRTPALRRRLFDTRAHHYLLALAILESEGSDIERILEDIRTRKIPRVKPLDEPEPTFEAIYTALKSKKSVT